MEPRAFPALCRARWPPLTLCRSVRWPPDIAVHAQTCAGYAYAHLFAGAQSSDLLNSGGMCTASVGGGWGPGVMQASGDAKLPVEEHVRQAGTRLALLSAGPGTSGADAGQASHSHHLLAGHPGGASQGAEIVARESGDDAQYAGACQPGAVGSAQPGAHAHDRDWQRLQHVPEARTAGGMHQEQQQQQEASSAVYGLCPFPRSLLASRRYSSLWRWPERVGRWGVCGVCGTQPGCAAAGHTRCPAMWSCHAPARQPV